MKNKKGLTLIELLVVVLIIGILAAIALPQYKKSVEKSRALQGQLLLKKIQPFYNNYYLTNDQYPSSINNLEIDIVLPDGHNLTFNNTRFGIIKDVNYADLYNSSVEKKYVFWYISNNHAWEGYAHRNKFLCDAAEKYEYICQSLPGARKASVQDSNPGMIRYYID